MFISKTLEILYNKAWSTSQLFTSAITAINDISRAILNPVAQKTESPGTFSKLRAGYCSTKV
jgi:hypothetical protein